MVTVVQPCERTKTTELSTLKGCTLWCVNYIINWNMKMLKSILFKNTFLEFIGVSVQFSSVTQLCLTLQPRGLQHARLPCPSPTPEACSNSCPLSCWCHQTISSSGIPLSFCLQYFPGSSSFISHQSSQRIFSTDFLQDWQIWSPCSPKDSQEPSPTPQFKSINSLEIGRASCRERV